MFVTLLTAPLPLSSLSGLDHLDRRACPSQTVFAGMTYKGAATNAWTD